MISTDPLEQLIAQAEAGNRTLAEHHLRGILIERESDFSDRRLWLWMAWLASSPQAMLQVLDRYSEMFPDCELAAAGVQWARGLNASARPTSQLKFAPEPIVDSIPAAGCELPLSEGESPIAVMLKVQQKFGQPLPAIEEQAEHVPADAVEEPAATIHSLEHAAESAADDAATPAGVESDLHASRTPVEDHADRDESTPRTDSAGVATTLATLQVVASTSLSDEASPAGETADDDNVDRPLGGDADHDGRSTILVVDDSPTVRKLLTMMLSQQGYVVVAANDGVDAARCIAADAPDLIVTDIQMPRLDGYKLCKLVTRNERTKHIPVVMISAGVIDSLRGKLAGCKDFVTKPITPEALLTVVQSLLDKSTAC